MSVVDPPTYGAERPSYKRLPSQTLGPEHTKKQAVAFYGDDKARTAVDKDRYAEDVGEGSAYQTSVPQPGYGVNAVAAVNQGGPQSAWMRRRSMSSPTLLRAFDWQSMGNAGDGAGAGVGR